jgi:hypothetical protein
MTRHNTTPGKLLTKLKREFMEFARILQWTLSLDGEGQGQEEGSSSRNKPPVLAHGVPAKVNNVSP